METGSETSSAAEQPAATQDQAEPSRGAPKTGTSEASMLLLEKNDALKADLSSERKKLRSIQEENTTLKQQVEQFQVGERKRGALEMAYTGLGSDFVVEDEQRAEISNIVSGLSISDDMESKITTLVSLAKRPVKQAAPNSPFSRPDNSSTSAPTVQHNPTALDLAKLATENPAEFARAMEAKRAQGAQRWGGK